MTSNDEGATIDLMDSFMPMNLISLENKARLHLHNIHFTRGNFVSGLLNVSAGAFLSLTSCSFSQMQYEDVGCVEMGYMAQVVIERTRVSGCHSTSSSSLGAFIHGLATASLSLLAVNVSNCSATAGSTLHILGASTVQLEDCHFSLCTGNRGGIMYGSGASFDMRNCVFRQSEALFGGVMHLWACNLRAYNCTFADAHSKSGGLLSLVGSPFDSVPVISIISSFFSAGTADHDGGAIRSSGAIDFFLLDSTFDHCSSREAGGAIYVANSDIHCSGCLFFNITSEGRGGVLSLRDGLLVSTVRNCLAQGAAAQTAGGSVTLSRDAKLIVTNSSLSNATAWFGGLISVHSSSSLELYHVLLAHGDGIEGSAIYLTEIAHFSGVFVSIVHACHTNTSTIFQQGSSLGHVIFLRAVTFTSDCSLDQVYLNGECRFPRCNDDQFSGYTLSPCGSGATCTDESVSGIPEFTSPICQCAEPSYASSLAADPTLAPYREGCVSPPRSESVNSLKSDLQESIHKNVLGSPYKLSQLGFRMVGTDLRPETMPFWNSTVIMNEHNSRSWVALVPSSGVLSVAEFQDFRVSVVLNSSALPEQTSPYEAVLCLFVASPVAPQYDKIFNVAVRLYVSASVVHSTSTWGRADNDTHLCHAVVFAPVESTKLKIGPASLPIPASPLFFQSCDVDSLPVQREIPRPDDSRSFEVRARDFSSGKTIILPPPTYVGRGAYAPSLAIEELGVYSLELFLVSPSVKHPIGNTHPEIRVSCQSGFVPDDGERACGCPVGFVLDSESGSCNPCPSFTSSRIGQGSCNVCAPGRYRYSAQTQATTSSCKICPPSVECGWNTTLATWKLRPSFWRVSALSTDVRPCLTVSNTSSPCAGGMNFSDNGDSYCADGFHGPLCETCTAAGTYFSRGECAICASLSTSIGIAVGSGLAVVLMALVIALQAGYSRGVVEKWTRQLKRQPTAGKMINFTTGTLECRRSGSRQGRGRTLHLRPWRSKSRSVLSFLQQVGFLAKFKLCVVFYQLVLTIPVVYGVTVPEGWHSWLSVFSWINLDFVDICEPACMGGVESQLHLAGLGSLGIVVAMEVLGALFTVGTQLRSLSVNFCYRVLMGGLPWALFAIFALTPNVSRTLFRVWSCRSYVSDSEERSVVEFLVMSTSTVCGSDEHASIQRVAIAYMIIWPVFMPLLCLLLVLRSARAINSGSSTLLTKATHLLLYEYRNEYICWETCSLMHRLLLSGYASLVPNTFGNVRIVSALAVSIVYSSLLMVIRPYKRADVNSLAVASNLVVTSAFVTALLIKLHDDISLRWSAEGASEVLGYDSTTDLAIVMAALCFFFLLFILAAMTRSSATVEQLVKRRVAAISELKRIQAAYDELNLSNDPLQPEYSGRAFLRGIQLRESSSHRSIRSSKGSGDERQAPTARPGDGLRARLSMIEMEKDGKAGKSSKEAYRSSKVMNAALHIRDPSYGLKQFFEDMVCAFPELELYLEKDLCAQVHMDPDSDLEVQRLRKHLDILTCASTGPEKSSTSGNSGSDEYKRTICALFGVYWLMRLDLPSVPGSECLDGQRGFCFGVDPESWIPLMEPPPVPPATATKRDKFFRKQDWQGFHQLMVDSGFLCQQPDGSVLVDAKRTAAMLTLTAIHDVMKVQDYLPQVMPEHAPYNGFAAGEQIGDHDIALGYVLEHDAGALPSYHRLDASQQAPVRFTQAKIGFNHGWLVQAEAPPGPLFSTFKAAIVQGGIDQSMIAFYFVHWLTDLGGAVPTPLQGMEKFVIQFPLEVLASFIKSFPLVQRLATRTETALFEEFLHEWWPCELGPIPTGPESICRMRLVVQAQSNNVKREVISSFNRLSPIERAILSMEMARTGIHDQHYHSTRRPGGPAFLIYYSPAFLRESLESVQLALSVLAEVYQAARYLYPLSYDPSEAGRSVTVRIDLLKGCGDAQSVISKCADGFTWILRRKNNQEAAVECVDSAELGELLSSRKETPPSFQILHIWGLHSQNAPSSNVPSTDAIAGPSRGTEHRRSSLTTVIVDARPTRATPA